MFKKILFSSLGMVLMLLTPAAVLAQRAIPSDDQQLLYEIYKELIEYKTTMSEKNNTIAAEGMAAWFQAAGFEEEDVFIGGALPHKGNIVARLRGTGVHEPIILMAHIDVVEAEREDWNVDPLFSMRMRSFIMVAALWMTKRWRQFSLLI